MTGPYACQGLQGCPLCQQIWRNEHGGQPGVCTICGGRHWPWEPHSEREKAMVKR